MPTLTWFLNVSREANTADCPKFLFNSSDILTEEIAIILRNIQYIFLTNRIVVRP